jgi:hypothetical protein
MSRFRCRPYLSLIAFLAFLAAGFGEAAGGVLCIGSDGHVSLEPALNGVCSEAAFPAAASGVRGEMQGSGSSMRASHCGPCVDFPFLVDHTGLIASHPVFSKARLVPSTGNILKAPAGPSMPGITAAMPGSGMRNDFAASASVSLRSIVLLT